MPVVDLRLKRVAAREQSGVARRQTPHERGESAPKCRSLDTRAGSGLLPHELVQAGIDLRYRPRAHARSFASPCSRRIAPIPDGVGAGIDCSGPDVRGRLVLGALVGDGAANDLGEPQCARPGVIAVGEYEIEVGPAFAAFSQRQRLRG